MSGPEFHAVIRSSWRPMAVVALELGISRRTIYNYFEAESIPEQIVEQMKRHGYNLPAAAAEPSIDWKEKYYTLLSEYNSLQKVVQNLTKRPRK